MKNEPTFYLCIDDHAPEIFDGPLNEARELAEKLVEDEGFTVTILQAIATCRPSKKHDWDFAFNVVVGVEE